MLPPEDGCDCPELVAELDKLAPAEVLEDLETWSQRLQASAAKWREAKGGAWRLMPIPPLFTCRETIKLACRRVGE